MEGDIAEQLRDGAHRFLDGEIAASAGKRARHWKRDLSSPEAYLKSVAENRARFGHIIGVRDARVESPRFEFYGSDAGGALVAKGEGFKVFSVRWPVIRDVTGTGLLLVPEGDVKADVVAIPDADVSPEQIAGIAPGVPAASQYARLFAESGFRVLVPMLINRSDTPFRISQREYLYRPAFELGRHMIGYEVQKVSAGIDCLLGSGIGKRGVGVFGWGEGACSLSMRRRWTSESVRLV